MHKLYLDMDGVLADFNRGVTELCHMKPMDQGHSTKEETDALWDAVRKVPHFYYQLKPIPGVVEMVKQLYQTYGDKVEILTGIPKPRRKIEHAAEDKVQWSHDILLPDIKVNIVYREEKPKYCTSKEDVLIDDYVKNIHEWEEHGGTGILFHDANEVMENCLNFNVMLDGLSAKIPMQQTYACMSMQDCWRKELNTNNSHL